MNIEEAKKKSYSISAGKRTIEDPIRYVSRLSGIRKAITEIKPAEGSELSAANGFDIISNFYKKTEDFLHEDDSFDKNNQEPHKHNRQDETTITELEKDPTIANHLYYRKYPGSRQPKLKSKEEQGGSSQFLGKRSAFSKASEEKDKEATPQKYKYCDPLTGAYYNTLDEFKKIRHLYAIDQRRELEKSVHYLGILNSIKNKKLLHLLTDSE